MTKMVDRAALKQAMQLQKQYIDKGDQANATAISEVSAKANKNEADVATLKTAVETLDTGQPFYVAAYNKGSNDLIPIMSQGNPEILKKFDFYLLDTTDNDGTKTTPVGKLKKNNLLRFENGNYAPTVGITQAQYDECMTNALYAEDGTELYAAGDYNAAAEWEVDKAAIQAGGTARKLFKANDGTDEVTHKLRPWETTETKYTIGIAPSRTLYILDNQVGASGKYWKGIFTEPRIWDGIDIAEFKLEPTAIGPCPITTINEGGVHKTRNFFYLYRGTHANCQSNAGLLPSNPFYEADRTYPRISDIHQVSNMNLARANNSVANRPYPFAEGGWWATNAFITCIELLAETRYIHKADMFGSGISSNDGTNDTNFYTSGGIRFKADGDADWTYRTFGANSAPLQYNASGATTNMDNLLTQSRPNEQCMESQMAASMATELGIAPTSDATNKNTFEFYGNTYYYMDVPGFAGLQDGDMHCRVYKVQSDIVSAFKGGVATDFEMEIVMRMSLFGGANLAGDIWAYNGGGLEMVGTREVDATTGLPISIYLQVDQTKWHNETVARKNVGEKFGFEDTYRKIGDVTNLGDSYTLERLGNTPFKIKKANNMAQGEAYYQWDNCYWANVGQRARIWSLFRCRSNFAYCSPRNLHANHDVLSSYVSASGSAQALIEVQP